MKSYFRVTPGPLFNVLKKHMDALQAANDAGIAWAKKHNMPVFSINYTNVRFKDDFIPDKSCWKKGVKGGFVPRLKNEEGRKLDRELRDRPQSPGWFELISDLTEGREVEIMRVNQIGTPGVKTRKDPEGNLFYLLVTDTYWLPDDRTGVEEIKASEFLI